MCLSVYIINLLQGLFGDICWASELFYTVVLHYELLPSVHLLNPIIDQNHINKPISFEATLFSRTITARNIEDQLQFLQVSPTSNADTRSIMALGIAWQKHLLKCARLFSPGLVVGLAVLTLWFLGGVMTLLLDLPRVWINGYI